MAIQENSNTLKQTLEYYTGYITEVEDPVLYKIKCDIPGHFQGVTAFPMRGEVDSPRVGDFVLLMSFDPTYHSYFLYQKLKENDFIGFRSNGKQVDITPDYIEISIFDPEEEWGDDQKDEKHRPTATSWIQMDKDGNLDISLNGDKSMLTINASDQVDIFCNGKCKIWASEGIELESPADITVKAGGNLNLLGTNIKIGASQGSGFLECNGIPIPGTPGPFIVPSVAPAPGTPAISTTRVQLNG